MNLDGEWRVAFIAAEHPELNYGTAAAARRRRASRVVRLERAERKIAGIPKNAKHKNEAGVLKYLTTN